MSARTWLVAMGLGVAAALPVAAQEPAPKGTAPKETTGARRAADVPARVLWQGAADEPAEGMRERLLEQLARIELAFAVERDFDAAGLALGVLWLRAAREVPYEGRFEVLTRLRGVTAELALELGEVQGARQALAHLLPTAITAGGVAGHYENLEGAWVAAGPELLAAEREALADPRLVALRERVARAAAPAEGDALLARIAGDPLLLRVHRALEEGDAAFLDTLGSSAVPALVELTELSIGSGYVELDADPLIWLTRLAELRAAELVAARLDAGGEPWRRRNVRAMRVGEVLSNAGTWDTSAEPTLCREPLWIEVLERLAADPALARECLPLVREVLKYVQPTPALQVALVADFESGDPDLVAAAMRELGPKVAASRLQPVLVQLLDHPDPAVRLFAASRLAIVPEPGAFLDATDNPDPAVRAALVDWADRRGSFSVEGLAMLDRLVLDEDPTIRRRAARIVVEELRDQYVSDDTYRRLAADPLPDVRARVARSWQHPDAELMTEVLVQLARDPSSEVIAGLDARLAEKEMAAEPGLAVTRARWEVAREGGPELSGKTLRLAAFYLCETAPGRLAVGRWIGESGELELVAGLAYRLQRLGVGVRELFELEPEALAAVVVGLGALEASDDEYAEPVNEAFALLVNLCTDVEPPPVAGLRLALRGPDATLRARICALGALGQLRAPGLEEDVLEVLRDPRWDGLDWSGFVYEALEASVEELEPARRNALLLGVVRDARTHERAADWLATRLAPAASGEAELIAAILDRWLEADGQLEAVFYALDALGRHPQLVEPERLIRAARGSRYASGVAGAMGRLRDPRYLEVLGECIAADWIEDSTARGEVQHQATWALTQYLSDEAAEVLLSGGAKTVEEDIRELCFEAVEKIARYQEEKARLGARVLARHERDDAVARVAVLLADEDPLVRAEAARAAATLGAVELLPDLIGLLRDPEGPVRTAARAALDRLNAPPDDE